MTVTSPTAATVRVTKAVPDTTVTESIPPSTTTPPPLTENEIKRRIKASRHDISRPALVSEFIDSPMCYLVLAMVVFFVCWLLSSYVLFPMIFKDRLVNEPTSKFFRQDNISSMGDDSNNNNNKRFLDSSPNSSPHDPHNSDEITLTPKNKVFKPLSNPHPEPLSLEPQQISTPIQRPTVASVRGKVPEVINLLTKVIATYPHDSTCFTQGYDFFNGELFESCGLYGKSLIRTVDYTTGRKQRTGPAIPAKHFAEGLAIRGTGNDAIIYMLTWKENVIHRYNATTLTELAQTRLPTHGWGITIDPLTDELVISDGSSTLFWYNPDTMVKTRSVVVKEWRSASATSFGTIDQLNELEWVGNEIWANVWYSTDILCIDPNSGQVVRRLQAGSVHSKVSDEDVLNGIAYGIDHNGDTKLLITGKLWKKTYALDWTQLVINDVNPIDPSDPVPMPFPITDDKDKAQ